MAFHLQVPRTIEREAAYVADWALNERFGLGDISVEAADIDEIRLTVSGADEVLCTPVVGGWGRDALADQPNTPPTTLPVAGANPLPILFGKPGRERVGDTLRLGFDIWGALFWCLARVEEVNSSSHDKHGRFPGAESYLFRAGLLDRPVADEYVEYLWQAILSLWPSAVRRKETGRMRVTCDVDDPYAPSLRSPRHLLTTLAADSLRRRSPAAFLGTLNNQWRVKMAGDYSRDPNNRFDWIMDRCEENGHQAAFYFICGNSNPRYDNRYELSEHFIRDLLKKIDRRGHEVGLHGSYGTFRNLALIVKERAALTAVCAALDIHQPLNGNRQHYLRYDSAVTPALLAAAGFDYDSSLQFADKLGFRCGTSHSFRLWNWQARAPLAIRERPLIAMDTTLFNRNYHGLTHDQAAQSLVNLKRACTRYGGDFVFLWHNSALRTPKDRDVYSSILSA